MYYVCMDLLSKCNYDEFKYISNMLDTKSNIKLSLTCWKYYVILEGPLLKKIYYKILTTTFFRLFTYHEIYAIILFSISNKKSLRIGLSITSTIIPLIAIILQCNSRLNWIQFIESCTINMGFISFVWILIILAIAINMDIILIIIVPISLGCCIILHSIIYLIHYRLLQKKFTKFKKKYKSIKNTY